MMSKTPNISRNIQIVDKDDDNSSKQKMETTFQMSEFLSVNTSQVKIVQNTNNTVDKQSNNSTHLLKIQDQHD